jgi:hypothetical protein
MSEVIQLPPSEFSSVQGASPIAGEVYSITDAAKNRLTGEMPNADYFDGSTQFIDAQLSAPEPRATEGQAYRSSIRLDGEAVSALIDAIGRIYGSTASLSSEVPEAPELPELSEPEMSEPQVDFALKVFALLALMRARSTAREATQRDTLDLAA